MIPRKVTNPLGQIRVDAGFPTQQHAAEALKCSKIYVSEVERGGRMPSPRMMTLMSKRFKLSEQRYLKLCKVARITMLKRELASLA